MVPSGVFFFLWVGGFSLLCFVSLVFWVGGGFVFAFLAMSCMLSLSFNFRPRIGKRGLPTCNTPLAVPFYLARPYSSLGGSCRVCDPAELLSTMMVIVFFGSRESAPLAFSPVIGGVCLVWFATVQHRLGPLRMGILFFRP